MALHAQCERCGKYEQTPDLAHHAFPVLPEKWQRLTLHEDRLNYGVMAQQVVLCPSCAGDTWGGIERQMKHRAKVAA